MKIYQAFTSLAPSSPESLIGRTRDNGGKLVNERSRFWEEISFTFFLRERETFQVFHFWTGIAKSLPFPSLDIDVIVK